MDDHLTVSLPVALAILFGAFCNASWNIVVKRGSDRFLSSVLVSVGCGIIGAACLPFLSGPAPASWPYIAWSVAAQVVYVALLAAAYQTGDVSQTYPLMRGTAPLLVAIASGPLIGERLSVGRWFGVGLISAGVLAVALVRSGPAAQRPWRAYGFALANAGAIASYTVIDGIGVRLSGAPLSYAFTTFVMTATVLAGWAAWRRPRDVIGYAVSQWRLMLFGGFGSFTSYSIAVWAMARAPVAIVASLRETSILFAVALSILILKEGLYPARLAATGLIVLGVIAIRVL